MSSLVSYEQIKSRFEDYRREPGNLPGHKGVFGAIIGVLEEACGGVANRYLLSKALTGKVHSKDWDAADWFAMYKFVTPVKDEFIGKWISGTPDFESLVGTILAHAIDQEGQTRMFKE